MAITSNHKEIKCSRCLLDSRYPSIKFNKEGICSECLAFEKKWGRQIRDASFLNKTTLKLEHILAEAKKGRAQFDCVVPTCGGIDSLYVLYLLKTTYKLNPLVITVDNAFLNPEAKRNLEIVTDKLGVKRILCNPGISKSLYKDFLLNTGTFCSLCVYSILFHVTRIAFENRIKFLIFGMSKREDAVLPHGTSPFKVFSIIKNYKNKFPCCDLIQKKSIMLILYYLLIGKVVNLPDYIQWDAEKNRAFLEKEFKIHLAGEHYDCIMHRFANWLAYKKYGFSYTTLKSCQKIRNGKIEKADAWREVKEKEGKQPENMKYFMDYFNITENDIETAIGKGGIIDSKFAEKLCQFLRRLYFRSNIFN